MNSRRVLLGDLLVQTKYCWGGGVHTGVCARLGHYLCEDSSITHQHREYISVCACVCPNVSVMVYNGRFTPSQDSTNVHTLRLLSPFPLRLSCPLVFNLLGPSRWQALWRCECVCLPSALVTLILSGVTHKDRAQIGDGSESTVCVSLRERWFRCYVLGLAHAICSTSECVCCSDLMVLSQLPI